MGDAYAMFSHWIKNGSGGYEGLFKCLVKQVSFLGVDETNSQSEFNGAGESASS